MKKLLLVSVIFLSIGCIGNGDHEKEVGDLSEDIFSQDYDVITQNPGIVIKNLVNGFKKILYYDTRDILKYFNDDCDQFINIYVLCGCDFCGISNIGLKRSIMINTDYDFDNATSST